MKPPQQLSEWVGGRGKYGLVRESTSKKDCPEEPFLMWGAWETLWRQSKGLPTVCALGTRVNGAWDAFLKKYPEATLLAETYGTKEPQINEEILEKWREDLMRLFGARPRPKVELKEADLYQSPVDVNRFNLFQAWSRRSGDPETEVCGWLEGGAPLGIEKEIKRCNIFPPSEEEGPGRWLNEAEGEAGFAKHGFRNYLSVEENLEDARIELERYAKEGYVMEVPLEIGLKKYEGGTLSKLGLGDKGERKWRKETEAGHRPPAAPAGNAKSHLPEKLVLPRPGDAIQMAREQKAKIKQRTAAAGRDGAEFVLIDVSDAFTILPVAKEEHRHSVAPGLDGSGLLVFKALLFGFKTAPLLYSRFGSLLARLLQSIVNGDLASHQVYLDDSLWFLTGTLGERKTSPWASSSTRSWLWGWGLLSRKVERSAHVQWVGVRFSLPDSETLVLNLPEKFLQDLRDLLQSWESKGMMPTKDLRSAAGKAAWLGSILPRAKWCVAVLYCVLKSVENDEVAGQGNFKGTASWRWSTA